MPTLIVEDGTGLATANAYISEAASLTYHADRGNTAWAAATQAAREAAIINATQYVDLRWQFLGEREVLEPTPQALAWPRVLEGTEEFLDAEGVNVQGTLPLQVVRAAAEYALIALTGPLMPVPTVADDGGRFVTLKREKLTPLEEETRYSAAVPIRTVRRYPVPDRMIKRSGLAVNSALRNAIR